MIKYITSKFVFAKFTFAGIEIILEVFMSLKEFFGKVFKKSSPTDLAPKENHEPTLYASSVFPIVKLEESQLSKYKAIPLTSLSALGAAFTQMSTDARTVVQSVTKNIKSNGKLFLGCNPKGAEGFLRYNEYGTTGTIFKKNPQGKQVISGHMSFKPVEDLSLTETTTTTLPLDPTLMVVAVALMTIEKKLDGIQKSVEEVLHFLKQEKRSRQRGNLNMLAEIMDDYKINCKNEKFCASRVGEVLSIKTAAYQDMDFYHNEIQEKLKEQKNIHGSKGAKNVLEAVTSEFAEYRVACYIFAFSTFLDVMLRKSFEPELIESETEKMLAMEKRYDALYADCHDQIEKYQRSAIDVKLLDGIGAATQGLGRAIGAVPVIKKSSLDEVLIDSGKQISQRNQEAIQRNRQDFESLESSQMNHFVDNLKAASALYNTENAMITDGENLFVLQSEQNSFSPTV